jgi:hypothetical protein
MLQVSCLKFGQEMFLSRQSINNFQLVGAENVASKLPLVWSRTVSFSPKH